MTDARLPGRHRPPESPSGSFGGITTGASSRAMARVVDGADTEPTPSAMRAARRRWATGVGVLTTFEDDGTIRSLRGATVSSFAVLSLTPPIVIIALEIGTRMAGFIPAAGAFAVSILDRAHEFQSDRFSGYGPQPDGAFTGIVHDLAVTGCPVLRDALAWFDCRVTSIQETGDHVLVFGEVVAVGVGPDTDDPLLNYEGAYRRIEGA